jgi:hypothetical protein
VPRFINFDREKALAPFQVTIRKQYSGCVKSVACFSPDADEPSPLSFRESTEQVRFTVPSTRLYSMIVIAQET